MKIDHHGMKDVEELLWN